MEVSTLSQTALTCKEDIAGLLATTGMEDSSRVTDLLREQDVIQIQERYDQWAGNLGALQPSSSALSLDHRLRDSSQVRKLVLSTLQDLHISIQTATDIAAGRRPNRATSSLDIDSDIDLSEYQVSSSDSETSCASSSGNERIAVGPTSELQELISAIKGGLDSLFRISVFIRKFAAQDRRQRASRAKPFDNRADIMYIKDRYPALAEKNEGLAIRLGEANSRRRQYFKYRRDHNDRLSTIRECQDTSEVDRLITRRAGGGIQTTGKTESVVTGRTAPSLFADTEATAFVKGEVPESQVAEPLDVPAAMSVVSFATSIAEASEDELPFPPLPPEADGRSSFMCPYCLTVVQMKKKDTEHQWRKHVLQDLEPYICTFPTCGLETYQSQHAWFEHELIAHRNRWFCAQCSKCFSSSQHLEKHIRGSHQEHIPDRQVPMIVSQSKQQIDSISPTECPFCDDPWAEGDESGSTVFEEVLVVDLDSFRRHVGHHLQQIALFSLPRLTQDQDAGSEDVGVLPDRDNTSQGYRWLREDCGRGWSIISRKRSTFIAFAYFLALYQNLRRCPSNTLLNWNPDDLLDSQKREGADWYAVFNPEVERVLDIELVHHLVHDSVVCCVNFSRDGKYLATGCNRSAQIFDVATGQKVVTLQDENVDKAGNLYIRSVCFSPDGKYLATAAEDKQIRVWNISSRSINHIFTHEDAIYSIDFAGNGRYLASGSADSTVCLWDVRELKLVHALSIEDGISSVAISPDGQYIAAGSLDKSVRIWDTTTGYLVERLQNPDGHKDKVYSVAFAPNGNDLVSGSVDKTIKLWELDLSRAYAGSSKGGKCVQTFEGHKDQDFVLSVCLTPDGRWVMSGSKDRYVQFWDPITGNAHMMLKGHENSVISVAPSPTGSLFATGSGDMSARIWRYILSYHSEFALLLHYLLNLNLDNPANCIFSSQIFIVHCIVTIEFGKAPASG
ncbi:WD40-repeat-containing domain protein [Aspergillus flavus]|uniref:WD40-repeat-containing domain protein n=1 Tax=Aspergillus flavus TaxID=5059 RepID=A0A5N6HCW6_ASPFL|nr:WD40-repeat-containing domain protein [Aspergillus flavus]